MAIPQTIARSEFRNIEAACADRAGESGGSAESDCARAMAQAERVLREISLTAFSTRRCSPELSSSVSEKAESAIRALATTRGSQSYTHSRRAAAQFGMFDLWLGRGLRCKPKFLFSDISSTCCGANPRGDYPLATLIA
jgi:hypothetical protein